ncbi:MAG: hypothetical protein MZW92_43415 [Comamonadaceae bacterium]|nr:hypothetical protein [Comamonadaceae bacterium]
MLRADRQAQGHRRRADRHADAAQRATGRERLRPGEGRARARGRAQARARHARGRRPSAARTSVVRVTLDPERMDAHGT